MSLLHRAMDILNERGRHILTEQRLKDEPSTLEEFSHVYDISHGWMRQIEVRAFEKRQKQMKALEAEQAIAMAQPLGAARRATMLTIPGSDGTDGQSSSMEGNRTDMFSSPVVHISASTCSDMNTPNPVSQVRLALFRTSSSRQIYNRLRHPRKYTDRKA